MIGAQGYPIYGQQMQPAYPQTYRPIYQPPQPMQMNQPQIDPAMVNARYVTCKEEAVAAQIIPDGSAYYFICEAQGRIYSKRFNPATNAAEFREFAIQQNQPQAEQFAPAGSNSPSGSLLLVGGTGLGKTHLITATAKEMKKNNEKELCTSTNGYK